MEVTMNGKKVKDNKKPSKVDRAVASSEKDKVKSIEDLRKIYKDMKEKENK